MPDNARRGFLKSLFAGGAAVAVAPWAATVAKAEPPKPLAKPNCLLAEQDEIWTLENGAGLPVHRIEIRLDFVPAITFQVMNEHGAVVRRYIIPRLSERELRVSKALQNKGFDALYSRRQLTPVRNKTEADLHRDERAVIIDSEGDTETPLTTILRERMEECRSAWLAQTSNVRMWGNEHEVAFMESDHPPVPKGTFVVVETPEGTEYGLGVTAHLITSGDMLIQAPARALFG